ncbi:MAG: hypothetical protein FJ090_04170 [Deltaproteobacteria bacterium]|nr:hypothetical protein [Deltaproteobacteria bacterium]
MKLLLNGCGAGVFATVCCCGGLLDDLPEAPEEGAAEEAPAGVTMYVVAASALKVRAAASSSAAEIGEFPRGTAFVVTGGATRRETVSGIEGGWVPVWVDGLAGYAFDGFLLTHAAPPATCTSLADWALAIGHAGAPEEVMRASCASMGIGDEGMDGACDVTRRTPLHGGGYYEQNEGYEWGSDTLYLPDVPRDAFWAAARNCLGSQGELSRLGLPRASGVQKIDAADGGEGAAVVGDDSWGWEWSEGCGAFLRVSSADRGYLVSHGGGC